MRNYRKNWKRISMAILLVLLTGLTAGTTIAAQGSVAAPTGPPENVELTPQAGYDPLTGYIGTTYYVWQDSTADWQPGSVKGYAEGEVAAFSVPILSGTPAGQWYFHACFE